MSRDRSISTTHLKEMTEPDARDVAADGTPAAELLSAAKRLEDKNKSYTWAFASLEDVQKIWTWWATARAKTFRKRTC